MNNNEKITPQDVNEITPLVLTGHISSRRGYLNSDQLTQLTIDSYRVRNGKGITYLDLMDSGLALHKRQAQDILKYHLKIGTIFTIRNNRPRQYYPSALKSEIIKNDIARITPIDPTGVAYSPNFVSSSFSHTSSTLDHLVLQTLEGHVLPFLPAAPLFIHNIHLKLRIIPECYAELKLPTIPGNNGKRYSDIIGTSKINYIFYPRGTVIVEVSCGNHSFKLQTEHDRSRLLVFIGQVRQALIFFLMDRHERIVPDVMEWQLTECDVNKDIKVSDWFHYTGLKIQVKHIDHLFCLYIKPMGKDTVYRVEERKHQHKHPLEFINDTINPVERVEKQLAEFREEQEKKLSAIHNLLSRFLGSKD